MGVQLNTELIVNCSFATPHFPKRKQSPQPLIAVVN
jgi:hypothetical protein